MITAKNYAAQAVMCISNKNNYEFLESIEYSRLETLGWFIEKSVHFALPDGGKILDNRGKSFAGGLVARLPFNSITIEYFDPEEGEKKLLLCSDFGEGSIHINGFYYYGGKWYPEMKSQIIANNCVESGGFIRIEKEVIYFESMTKIFDCADNQDNGLFCVITLLELLEALSCANVSAEVIEPVDPKKNLRRVNAGKLPFYETKFLVLKVPHKARQDSNGAGSHASPRQHLRRGHIRRLESGNVWVNSCIVGDPAKGIIKKSYSVVKRLN